MLHRPSLHVHHRKWSGITVGYRMAKISDTSTVIVPLYNGARFLYWQWDALEPQLKPNDEVIFIDDCSNDGSAEIVRGICDKRVRLIENRWPLGFSGSVNLGFEAAQGDIIFLLNQDVIPITGMLCNIAEELVADQAIGSISAILLFPQDGTLQHAGVGFTNENHVHIYSGLSGTHKLAQVRREVQAFAFAACGIRRNTMLEIGHLDPGFVNGYEDFDYCFRLRNNGYKLVVSPLSRGYHWERQAGPVRSSRRKENVARLWKQWGSSLRPDLADYTSESIRYLGSGSEVMSGPIVVVDMANTSMSDAVVQGFCQSLPALRVADRWEYSRQAYDAGAPWLPLLLPPHAANHPQPFLYIVSNFRTLSQNVYWHGLRRGIGVNDFVADTNGNVIWMSDICRQKLV